MSQVMEVAVSVVRNTLATSTVNLTINLGVQIRACVLANHAKRRFSYGEAGAVRDSRNYTKSNIYNLRLISPISNGAIDKKSRYSLACQLWSFCRVSGVVYQPII